MPTPSAGAMDKSRLKTNGFGLHRAICSNSQRHERRRIRLLDLSIARRASPMRPAARLIIPVHSRFGSNNRSRRWGASVLVPPRQIFRRGDRKYGQALDNQDPRWPKIQPHYNLYFNFDDRLGFSGADVWGVYTDRPGQSPQDIRQPADFL